MKTLDLKQMEGVEGGGTSFWTRFSCAVAVIAGGAALYSTGGLAAGIVCNLAAAACGGLLGSGI